MVASAPIHVFLEFYKPVFRTIFFPSHCLLSDITIMKTTDSKERMNPVGIAVINPRKEYWRSRESNRWPPVLKSATLPTELWGSSVIGKKTLTFSHISVITEDVDLTLSQRTNFRHFQTERVCRRQFKIWWKWVLQKGRKTLWEKEKLLVTSNFSFSHSVFQRLVLQTRENHGLFGNGLKLRLKSVPNKKCGLDRIESISRWPNNYYLTNSHTVTPFDASGKQAFWKHYPFR